MARRLPPVLEAATRTAETAADRWRHHRRVCHGCATAANGGPPGSACEPGYRLWQDESRTARAAARLRAVGAGQEQLTMPAC